MPNWVYSNLTVTGPKVDVLDFAKSLIYQQEKPIKLKAILDAEGIKPEQADYSEKFRYYYDKALAGEYNELTDEEDVGFDKLIPQPQEVKIDLQRVTLPDNMKWDVFKEGWYGWNCDNWGSKWGMCDVSANYFKEYIKKLENLEEEESTLELEFTTAWSPSTVAFQKISEMYKNLEFTCSYEEEAGLFFIEESYHNGEVSEIFNAKTRAEWYCYRNGNLVEVLNDITCDGDAEIINEMLEPDSSDMLNVVAAAQSFYTEEDIIEAVNCFTQDNEITSEFKDRFFEVMEISAMS